MTDKKYAYVMLDDFFFFLVLAGEWKRPESQNDKEAIFNGYVIQKHSANANGWFQQHCCSCCRRNHQQQKLHLVCFQRFEISFMCKSMYFLVMFLLYRSHCRLFQHAKILQCSHDLGDKHEEVNFIWRIQILTSIHHCQWFKELMLFWFSN